MKLEALMWERGTGVYGTNYLASSGMITYFLIATSEGSYALEIDICLKIGYREGIYPSLLRAKVAANQHNMHMLRACMESIGND